MRCFTVTECRVTPNISIVSSPYPHIGVGEEGRGRSYVRFPVGRSLSVRLTEKSPCPKRMVRISWAPCSLCGTAPDENAVHPDAGEIVQHRPVERASVIRTREKGTLLLVEEKDPADRRALVLADIAAGFRGGTTWTGADREEVPCRLRGKAIPLGSMTGGCCDYCGTPAVDDRTHPDAGTEYQYAAFPMGGVTVLAEGYRAQGAAGRMGGHAVRLLIMEPGACFRVVRHGRLYGAPAARYVYWDGENLRLGTQDEIFPPSEETENGEVI